MNKFQYLIFGNYGIGGFWGDYGIKGIFWRISAFADSWSIRKSKKTKKILLSKFYYLISDLMAWIAIGFEWGFFRKWPK